MVAVALMRTATAVLTEIVSGIAPQPEQVELLRAARPDLTELPVDELACEIVKTELAKVPRIVKRPPSDVK